MQLQYNDMLLLLRQWFVQGHNATLKNVSYLENVAEYRRNTDADNYNELINEFLSELTNQRNFYKPQERPPC